MGSRLAYDRIIKGCLADGAVQMVWGRFDEEYIVEIGDERGDLGVCERHDIVCFVWEV